LIAKSSRTKIYQFPTFLAARSLAPLFAQLVGVRPQMIDLGSEQGLSNFETATIAGYF
jgi:hypothetical protein